MNLDIRTLIVAAVLVALLIWVIVYTNLIEPWRTLVIVVIVIGLIFALLRVLGVA